MAQEHYCAEHYRNCNSDRSWTFLVGDEWRREHGPGLPGNCPPQVEESRKGRLRDLHLQHALYVAGVVLRDHDHPRLGAAEVPGQSDRRFIDVPRGSGSAETTLLC